MATTQPVPAQPDYRQEARRGRGLAVASLVIGVASLVAAISFVLFPVALVGGIIGAILGIIALSRRRGEGGNGQAVAGLICSLLALALAITLTVRVGTWAKHNRRPLTTLSKCLAKADQDRAVRVCFVQFANQVRD
jgi:membrane-bound ClpP family serine protease